MEWFTRTYRVSFYASICVPVGNDMSAVLLCFAVRDAAGAMSPCIHTYIRGYTIICPKASETSVRVLCLDEADGLQPTTTMTSARGMDHYSAANTNGDVEA